MRVRSGVSSSASTSNDGSHGTWFLQGRKAVTAEDVPFLRAAAEQLRHAGLHGTPVDQLRVVVDGRTYDIFQLVTSYPLISAGLARIQLDRRAILDIAQVAGDDGILRWAHMEDEAARHHAAKWISAQLRAGCRRFGRPRQVPIPKTKYTGSVHPLDLLCDWLEPQDVPTGKVPKRKLTIDTVPNRAVAWSIQWALSHYLTYWWSSSVVAYRPGICIPQVLGTLAAVVEHTDRQVLLALDLRQFFDRIPIPRLIDQLNSRFRHQGNGPFSGLLHDHLRSTSKNGLPQGSPLSPLFANIFAQMTIDPLFQAYGPTIRYADDVVIAFRTVDEARAALPELQKSMVGHGMVVALEKTEINDLRTGLSYDHKGQNPTARPMRYLGVDLQLNMGRLEGTIGEPKIRQLYECLREAWFGIKAPNLSQVERTFARMAATGSMLDGWMAYFGAFLRRGSPAHEALGTIVPLVCRSLPALNGLFDAELQGYPQGADRRRREAELCKGALQALGWIDPTLHQSTREAVGRQTEHLDHILRQSQERLQAGRASPLNLRWTESGRHQYLRELISSATEDATSPSVSALVTAPDELPLPDHQLLIKTRKGGRNPAHSHYFSPLSPLVDRMPGSQPDRRSSTTVPDHHQVISGSSSSQAVYGLDVDQGISSMVLAADGEVPPVSDAYPHFPGYTAPVSELVAHYSQLLAIEHDSTTSRTPVDNQTLYTARQLESRIQPASEQLDTIGTPNTWSTSPTITTTTRQSVPPQPYTRSERRAHQPSQHPTTSPSDRTQQSSPTGIPDLPVRSLDGKARLPIHGIRRTLAPPRQERLPACEAAALGCAHAAPSRIRPLAIGQGTGNAYRSGADPPVV